MGEFDRDDSGMPDLTQKDKDGNYLDKQGRPVNPKGYLIDPATGDIIDNLKGLVMFPKEDVDPLTGELPAPFNWEKYNFDPQAMQGEFDLLNGQPRMLTTNKGFCVDKKGRKVNKNGWL